jgi:hypothetical protein
MKGLSKNLSLKDALKLAKAKGYTTEEIRDRLLIATVKTHTDNEAELRSVLKELGLRIIKEREKTNG